MPWCFPPITRLFTQLFDEFKICFWHQLIQKYPIFSVSTITASPLQKNAGHSTFFHHIIPLPSYLPSPPESNLKANGVSNFWYIVFFSKTHHKVPFNFSLNVFILPITPDHWMPPNGADGGGAKLCRGGGAKLCLVLGILKGRNWLQPIWEGGNFGGSFFFLVDRIFCFGFFLKIFRIIFQRDFLLAVPSLGILFSEKKLKEITDFEWVGKECFPCRNF